MKKTAFTTALLALALLAIPAVAADSPEGLKCPVQTMDGKWVSATNVTPDCVAKSISSDPH